MTHVCAPGCTCHGTSAPDPSFKPDEQEKDGPFELIAVGFFMACVMAVAILI